MTSARWLLPWHREPGDHPVLLCVPPAGAGCGQYGQWQELLGPSVSVVGAQLPGRERRWAESPPGNLYEVVDALARELHALVPARTPLVVFGESFGGLIGYEVTRRLGEAYRRWPTAVVVAACRPPHCWVGAGQGLVDDDAELARLLELRGLGEHDLDEDSREMMLELLRNDARLSLTYADPAGARVACPLLAWGGTDDEVVTAGQLDDWRPYAGRAGFHRRQFPGGHHFCTGPAKAVPVELGALLAP